MFKEIKLLSNTLTLLWSIIKCWLFRQQTRLWGLRSHYHCREKWCGLL